jgi:hypothetical protein
MAFCTTCGKQNPDTAKFCTGCGGALQTSIQQPNTLPTPFKNKGIIIAVAVAIVLLIGSYFLFFNKSKKATTVAPGIADTTTVAIPPAVQAFIPHSEYSVPEELLYTGKRETVQNGMKYYPCFFPIGWSRDGKFAAVETREMDTEEGYFFNIYITDMITDKLVWTWSYRGTPEKGYSSDPANKKDFTKVWNNNKQLIVQQLNAWQIEPVTPIKLERLPFNYNGNNIGFATNNNTFYSNDFGQTMIQSASVYCKVNGEQKKRVYNQKYDPYSSPLSNNIIGYIKNPLENRMLLLLLSEFRGWEGIPTEMQIHLIGCDLNNIGINN